MSDYVSTIGYPCTTAEMPNAEHDSADQQYGMTRPPLYTTDQILMAQAEADDNFWDSKSTTSDYVLAAAVPQAALAEISSAYVSARGPPRLMLVPQEPFQGPSNQDFAKDVVEFETIHGGHIILANALRGDVDDLADKDRPAFPPGSVSSKISIRIQFANQTPFHHRQVMALRSTNSAESISRGKLAHTIAKETSVYLAGREELTVNGRIFPFEDVLLLRLRRVSNRTWQPEFYVSV